MVLDELAFMAERGLGDRAPARRGEGRHIFDRFVPERIDGLRDALAAVGGFGRVGGIGHRLRTQAWPAGVRAPPMMSD